MESSNESGYPRRLRSLRIAALAALALLVALVPSLSALADGEAFSGGGKAGGDAYKYAAGPYATTYQDSLYLYGTSDDGKGYYATYADGKWADWKGWDEQPADYQWQPTAVAYGDKQYVFYDGKDNKVYYNAYDGSAWSGWEDTSGDYNFAYAPYANTYGDKLYLYGAADDGNLYAKSYDGEAWGDWTQVNTAKAGNYQPYAVEWGDHENVFYTGDDGKVYWNRYDGTKWTGEKALMGDDTYDFAYSPYAVGYAKDKKLCAYAVAKDGTPYHNAFADGKGWSGWEPYKAKAPAKVKYQPSVYVYKDVQHLVYTGEDGHGYYTTYDGTWGDWQDLGDNYDYDPYQYEYGDSYYWTYTGTDGYVYYKTYSGDGAAVDDDDTYQPTPTPAY